MKNLKNYYEFLLMQEIQRSLNDLSKQQLVEDFENITKNLNCI